MTSRNVVQQNKGEPILGAIKHKKMGAEGKSRRALGDIGNLVPARGVEGKQLTQVSRPATRSFCAQLLANAQAAADKNNKDALAVNPKGPIVPDGVLPNKKAAVRKPSLKKAVEKSNKPQEIIEISPDTVEKQQAAKCIEKCDDKSGKKKGPTLTGTLTARSKAACGLSKEQIADVDAADSDNHLAVVEYVEEIYKFYKMVEKEGHVHDYMRSQPEISEKMRAILVDWLIQVHGKFDLSPETLYLTINILDRYLASTATSRRDLQLLGLSSILIASKYEEIWPPQVDELACISDQTCSNEQILVMEKRILGSLEWCLTVPTPYVFLVRFIKVSQTDSDVENMAYFLAELGMMNYETLTHCPSMIAASAVYAARCTLNKTTPLWNKTLEVHTGFAESQLLDCAKLLVTYHSMVAAADHKQKGAYRKYSSPDKGSVALLPPAKSLLLAQ